MELCNGLRIWRYQPALGRALNTVTDVFMKGEHTHTGRVTTGAGLEGRGHKPRNAWLWGRAPPSPFCLWIFFDASCGGAKLITPVTLLDRAESLGQKNSYGGLCGCPGVDLGELAEPTAMGFPGENQPLCPQTPEWRNPGDPVNVSFNYRQLKQCNAYQCQFGGSREPKQNQKIK